MKKIINSSLVLVLSVFSFGTVAMADVIPPNSHPVNKCVKFVNLNGFSNVSLIGSYTGPMDRVPVTYQIENGKCLQKGYKFNRLTLYWNTNDKAMVVDSKNKLSENIEPYGGTTGNGDPLITDTVEYSIAGMQNSKLVIYKSKETNDYNNGSPSKVETFKNPLGVKSVEADKNEIEQNKIAPAPVTPSTIVDTKPAPKPEKKGFWSRVWCFFGASESC
jgi:hypothetical protein